MKATEQYFPVVLFVMLYKAILTSQVCEWSPKVWPFRAALSSSAIYICIQMKPIVVSCALLSTQTFSQIYKLFSLTTGINFAKLQVNPAYKMYLYCAVCSSCPDACSTGMKLNWVYITEMWIKKYNDHI